MSGTLGNGLTRRAAIATGAAATLLATGRVGFAQAKTAPITIVINQSPWFDSFRKTVELYEKETGREVELDVNPFAGSLEKQRNSVRTARGQYDLLIMNSGWFAEMYFGGFLEPITDIDSGFTLDPGIYKVGDTIYFDAAKRSVSASGKLMSIPINPNIPLLYYRSDLYQQNGLKAPETFAELQANARKLHSPPRIYGIVQRGARGPHTVAYDFYPYLYGHGGAIFKDERAGDFTVLLNNPEGKAALDYYITLAREAGHPKTAALDQAEVIQNMVTGKSAHMLTVIAAWPQMDDPAKSAVVDKVDVAPPPHAPGLKPAPGLGHWLAGIAKNVPDERKRAAVAFLQWFQTREAQVSYLKNGGIPIHGDAYKDPVAGERKYRWVKAMAESLPHAVHMYYFPEAAEVIPILELGLNRAIAGEIGSTEALNGMADQVHAVMAKYNYNTAKLPPLR
jgi:multiple sugar transport system substrate-binding protein